MSTVTVHENRNRTPLAQRALAARRAAGLRQDEVARQLGWVPSRLSAIETGQKHLTPRNYHRIMLAILELQELQTERFRAAMENDYQ